MTEIVVHAQAATTRCAAAARAPPGRGGPPGVGEDRAAGAEGQGKWAERKRQGAGTPRGGRRRCRRRRRPARASCARRATPSSRCRSRMRPCRSKRGRETLRGLPQRRHRRGQHSLPAQGRQPGTDRAGLTLRRPRRPPRVILPSSLIDGPDSRVRRRHHPDDPARPRGVAEPRPRAARRRRGARSPHHHPAHRRRPASRSPASTPTCARGASWCSARARSASSRASSRRRAAEVLAADLSRYPLPCVLVTDGLDAAARGAGRSRPRAACRCCGRAPRRRDAMSRLSAVLDIYLARAGRRPRRADGHPRPRRADDRGERHRQERVRARPGRPRPPAGRRRRGGAALPGAVVRDRHLPGADAAPHGDPRPRPDQRPGPVRRRLDADVEAGRAGGAAGTLGAGARVRSARPRRAHSTSCSASASRWSGCRWRRAATSPSSSRSRRATSCCAPADTTRRAGWSSGSTAALGAGEPSDAEIGACESRESDL